METHLEMQKALRRLPRLVKKLSQTSDKADETEG
jgi:hypothetical protein